MLMAPPMMQERLNLRNLVTLGMLLPTSLKDQLSFKKKFHTIDNSMANMLETASFNPMTP